MNTRYFIRYNPTKKFVQKLYRLVLTDIGDSILQYHGEQGSWHYSFSYNGGLKAQEEFINSELTEEVTEQEIQEYINQT